MRTFDVRRELADAERAEVDALLNDAWRADGVRPLNDHMWLDLREGGRRGYACVIARDAGHDHIIGYCQVSRGNDSWLLDVVIHPHHRYDIAEIGPGLLTGAMGVIAGDGGGHVHWWVFEANNAHAGLAHGAGLTPSRRLLQMRRPLPLEEEHLALVGGFATEEFRPGRDEDEWLAVNNAAFATHPEQGGWTRSTIDARMTEAWFDPAGFLLHRTDGRIDGFCWTKIHRTDDELTGEIYAVAVDPHSTSRGLGRKLTAAGLAHLTAAGAATAMLYVDADNAPALAVYERLGFRPHHTERAFTGDIAPS